jgi:hypothetical protein
MKIVQVRDSDYKLQVQNGGQIVLDTGNGIGQVYITGDLYVNGLTTTINSTTLTVDDNIIILNKDDPGPGVTLIQSGIQIERQNTASFGSPATHIQGDVLITFNESSQHINPTTLVSMFGTFDFKNQSGTLVGIKTNSIMTGGTNLVMIGSGNGVLSVQGTNNYEQNVLDYGDPLLPALNDDFIPNMRAVSDYVAASFTGILQPGIEDGDTSVRTKDQSSLNNPLPSVIEFKVDNVLIAEMNSSGLEIGNVIIGGDTITNNSINNLTITSNTNEVDMDAVVNLLDQSDPIPAAGACKIYTKSTVGSGDTGIYYANTKVDYDGSTVINLQDELVSKNRALLFSMIF